MNRSAIALVSILAALPLAATAAEGGKTCSLYPRPKPPEKAGDWVEYRIKGIAVPATMKMAVTGVETIAGKDVICEKPMTIDDEKCYWLEISMNDGRQTGVVKSLLVGDPIAPKRVRRVIMKTASMPAMELPKAMIGAVDMAKNPIAGTMQCTAVPGAPVDVSAPDETLTVAGKPLTAKVTKVTRDGKLYVFKHSDKVPLTGLVWADFNPQIAELIGFGHDATSMITEEPVPLEQAMPGLVQPPLTPGTPPGSLPGQPPAAVPSGKPGEANPAGKATQPKGK